jgi:hypothetical protein
MAGGAGTGVLAGGVLAVVVVALGVGPEQAAAISETAIATSAARRRPGVVTIGGVASIYHLPSFFVRSCSIRRSTTLSIIIIRPGRSSARSWSLSPKERCRGARDLLAEVEEDGSDIDNIFDWDGRSFRATSRSLDTGILLRL